MIFFPYVLNFIIKVKGKIKLENFNFKEEGLKVYLFFVCFSDMSKNVKIFFITPKELEPPSDLPVIF